mgnify:CR=1 FL=1
MRYAQSDKIYYVELCRTPRGGQQSPDTCFGGRPPPSQISPRPPRYCQLPPEPSLDRRLPHRECVPAGAPGVRCRTTSSPANVRLGDPALPSQRSRFFQRTGDLATGPLIALNSWLATPWRQMAVVASGGATAWSAELHARAVWEADRAAHAARSLVSCCCSRTRTRSFVWQRRR